MLALWLPLAASIVMMVLEPSVINIGLGRTQDAELALAAFGVALSLALLVEAPILMILDASVARSTGRASFAVVRRFTLALGLAVTAGGLLASLTPLYSLLVVNLMNIPADVAARARPTLQILSLWPFPVAWRRAHQGVLIRAGRTSVISVATGVRLICLAGALLAGLSVLPGRSDVVVGVAMVISVSVEAVLTTWATGPIMRQQSYGPAVPARDGEPSTFRELWRFYRPLLATTILRQSSRPLLNAGIAAAVAARSSLAAWPVAWGFAMLIAGPAWSLQQLATALAVDGASYRSVWRFSLGLSALLTGLLALTAFTPAYALVMGGVYNLSPELQSVARPATRLLTFYPLLMGVQGVYRGALIRSGLTRAVRSAMIVNLGVLLLCLWAGAALGDMSGAVLAAGATMVSNSLEAAWLRREKLVWASSAGPALPQSPGFVGHDQE